MNNSNSRFVKPVTLVAAIVFGGALSISSFAQGAPVLLDSLVALLNRLQASVDGVQASVDEIQTTVDALGATSNVRLTPPIEVYSGTVLCVGTNVADSPRQIGFRAVNFEGGTIIGFPPVVRPAGSSFGVGYLSPSVYQGLTRCEFTVVDGTRADIRGNLTASPDLFGNPVLTVAAE